MRQLLRLILHLGLLLTVLSVGLFYRLQPALADSMCNPPYQTFVCTQGCTAVGDCPNGSSCVIAGSTVAPVGSACGGGAGSWLIGGVDPPQGVAAYNGRAGLNGIGIMYFISNAIKLFAVVCGLLVFGNFLYSGYLYITGAGNAESHTKVRERVTWSVLGLVLLIAAYMAIALLSLLIFGDATFILNPNLFRYGALAP